MTWLLSASVEPFTVAGLVLIGLVLFEMAGTLLVGAAPSEAIDASPLGYFLESALGWLNLGKVPFLVLLMVMLALFSAVGFFIQAIASHVVAPLPGLVAVPFAAFVALLGTRSASRLVARIFPRDETYVVSDADLVGLVGVVTVGPLEAGTVGRIKVVDRHGNRHFPRARPSVETDTIEDGASVLIVEMSGREFRVIRAPENLTDR